jgi:hypothetical protein
LNQFHFYHLDSRDVFNNSGKSMEPVPLMETVPVAAGSGRLRETDMRFEGNDGKLR